MDVYLIQFLQQFLQQLDNIYFVMNIQFEKAELKHIDTIFEWLRQPHMMEFWDNTQDLSLRK